MSPVKFTVSLHVSEYRSLLSMVRPYPEKSDRRWSLLTEVQKGRRLTRWQAIQCRKVCESAVLALLHAWVHAPSRVEARRVLASFEKAAEKFRFGEIVEELEPELSFGVPDFDEPLTEREKERLRQKGCKNLHEF